MGDKLTASGNIVAEDVVLSNDYISIIETENLQYYQTGFAIPNPDDTTNGVTVSELGRIAVKYRINVDKCKELYKDSTAKSLRIRINLETNAIDSNGNIFSYVVNSNEICSSYHKIYNNDGVDITEDVDQKYDIEYEKLNDHYSIELTLDSILNSSGNYFITVEYYFKVDSLSSYKTYFYTSTTDKLSKVEFSSSALISEVE